MKLNFIEFHHAMHKINNHSGKSCNKLTACAILAHFSNITRSVNIILKFHSFLFDYLYLYCIDIYITVNYNCWCFMIIVHYFWCPPLPFFDIFGSPPNWLINFWCPPQISSPPPPGINNDCSLIFQSCKMRII
jgi:hypothetical protein